MVSTTLLALWGLVPPALAGFLANSHNNIAIYWGQNSANRPNSQQRLATYCTDTPVNIIPIAFLHSIKSPTLLNFANAGDNCTVFPSTQLLSCPEIESDIQTCQSLGKTVLLSLGGATYTEGGFASPSEATRWADTLWAMFGPRQPSSTVPRPFGSAVIDGFDFDFEDPTQNMAVFAARLRTLMDNSPGRRRYFLSAAPQCPFPDHAMDEILQGVKLDFVSIQFYNNYCGAPAFLPGVNAVQNNFNLGTWDRWARTAPNPGVKVLVGIPGSPSAAGSGYVTAQRLGEVLGYARRYASFGGVMVWDMSQVEANGGFLDGVEGALRGVGGHGGGSESAGAAPVPVPVPGPAVPPAPVPVPAAGEGGVPQWGQCGGKGYGGPTGCQAPYTCVHQSEWWAHCN
ncbi:endochitinase 33 [Podospora aff. communis PSN243]|uniref:chitinase n=1 Tax=Podospora aff. communis PSN243 TaxID=3040156 RepID=A0AAV9GJR1_9PEZI|nr:endochitinase 33 [Podospora aff. communis PSN243]